MNELVSPGGSFSARLMNAAHSIGGEVLQRRRGQAIYTAGQRENALYLIETGLAKMVVMARDGRECITGLYGPGDLLGEACLGESGMRGETVIAMKETVAYRVPERLLLGVVASENMHEEFTRYLARRLRRQQQMIATLLTGNGEYRLASTLVMFASPHPERPQESLVPRLRHEEWAVMIGTTRTRVGQFLKKFAALELISMGADRRQIVFTDRMERFLQEFRADLASVEREAAHIGVAQRGLAQRGVA